MTFWKNRRRMLYQGINNIDEFLEVLNHFGKKRILNKTNTYNRHSTYYSEVRDLPQMKIFPQEDQGNHWFPRYKLSQSWHETI